jgi:hypothetical protein
LADDRLQSSDRHIHVAAAPAQKLRSPLLVASADAKARDGVTAGENDADEQARNQN